MAEKHLQNIYWDHAVSWGGVWVNVSDIGRVGKKVVLRRIPIHFLSTIFHDLKPKLASKTKGKRHNRVYPGQNATQQGTYLFTE